MYGMIHKALRDMAVRQMGDAAWHDLLRSGGFTQPLFIGMEYYSDATTMGMIHLLANHLGRPLEDVLHEFGREWIDFAGASEYGRILAMSGDDFISFLESLDRMHASIRSNMPRAEMPSFEVLETDETTTQLRYRSNRTGLEPFVQGILLAAAERFGERVAVEYTPEDDGTRFTIVRAAPHA